MARARGGRGGTRRTLGDKIACPKFDPELVDFEHWREDVHIWRGITSTRKSAQGGVLYLAIEVKAKQHVHNMKFWTQILMTYLLGKQISYYTKIYEKLLHKRLYKY